MGECNPFACGAEIHRLRTENAALRSALRECADDLEFAVNVARERAGGGAIAEQQHQFSMAPVLRARALLEPSDTDSRE